jgi:hypothetical protein
MALARLPVRIGVGKEVTTMNTHVLERNASVHAHTHLSAAAGKHIAWLIGGFALGFLVPFVFADTLELPRDLFYAVYVVSVGALFFGWAKTTGQDLGPMFRRRWVLALALGLTAAAVLAAIVLQKESTSRPEGLDLVAAVVWRGVVYGAADGLLLSVFPILAVFAIFEGTKSRQRVTGKIAIALAALVASMAMTATYHLGYSDFRSAKLRQPIAGDVVWSAPTLLTLNPIGAPIAHAGLHVSAVLHSYETDLFLPPHK